MQHNAIQCNTMHNAIQCNTMQYNAIQCNTSRASTVPASPFTTVCSHHPRPFAGSPSWLARSAARYSATLLLCYSNHLHARTLRTALLTYTTHFTPESPNPISISGTPSRLALGTGAWERLTCTTLLTQLAPPLFCLTTHTCTPPRPHPNSNLKPRRYTLVVGALGRTGAWESALGAWGAMLNAGVEPDAPALSVSIGRTCPTDPD